jgi:hypothetical protein
MMSRVDLILKRKSITMYSWSGNRDPRIHKFRYRIDINCQLHVPAALLSSKRSQCPLRTMYGRSKARFDVEVIYS